MNAETQINNNKEAKEKILSWPAIFAGTVFTVAVTAMLNLFGVGSGLTAFAFTGLTSPAGMTTGAFIWLLISTVIALFMGAWLAGFMLRYQRHRLTGIVQGLMIWSFATIISLATITTGAGLVMSGTANLAKGTLSAMTNAQPQILLGNGFSSQAFNELKGSIKERMQEQKINTNAINKTLSYIKQYLTASSSEKKKDLRKKISIMIAENSSMSYDQSSQMIDEWEKSYNEFTDMAKDKLQQTAKDASKAMSSVFFALFFINILSGIAAVAGGIMGHRRYPRTVAE